MSRKEELLRPVLEWLKKEDTEIEPISYHPMGEGLFPYSIDKEQLIQLFEVLLEPSSS